MIYDILWNALFWSSLTNIENNDIIYFNNETVFIVKIFVK